MSNLVVNRTPEVIAAEINSIKEQTRKVVLYNSIEIGRKLVEAKELVPHGEWGNWLEEAVDYSKSTANNLMKIFEEYGSDQITLLDDNLKSQAFGNLNYSQAVLLLGLPSDDREKFVEENKVDEMSTRELKKAIDDLKKANKEKDNALKERDEAIEKLSALEESNRILEETFNEGAEERNSLEEKVKELEKEIEEVKSSKPVETVNVDWEEITAEVQEKMDQLIEEKEAAERKIKELESKQNNSSVKFKIYFEEAGRSYQKLLEELASVKEIDEVEYIKYRKATEKFLNKMLERVLD
ncbi:DUF3102 domain-containing protein [Clostridium disporicum]|uniref:Protein of uncharacterized function (DUF3102) n=1 Tax=Clostridium disporicum TaxID=84024 RepID=A0A174DKF9_9CLOT|nr:DUF3102 domain-containing protein [Clostridium disporicum]CUO24380.1 Protein of uncharacterised function (DUF3102) [Clostridium disporicum]